MLILSCRRSHTVLICILKIIFIIKTWLLFELSWKKFIIILLRHLSIICLIIVNMSNNFYRFISLKFVFIPIILFITHLFIHINCPSCWVALSYILNFIIHLYSCDYWLLFAPILSRTWLQRLFWCIYLVWLH